MGLAASQARLLTITARKADCEFQSMTLSHQKIALSRDMEKISDEYQNAMNKTKLIYDYYGSGTSQMALNYGILMKPSAYNDYSPKVVTDCTNRVVLSGEYAAAAHAAGIPVEGYYGTASSEVRNKFIEALKDNNVISATTATNVEGTDYNNAVGLGYNISMTQATKDVTYNQLMDLVKSKTSSYSFSMDDFYEGAEANKISGDNNYEPYNQYRSEHKDNSYPNVSYLSDSGTSGTACGRGTYIATGTTAADQQTTADINLYDLLSGDKQYTYVSSTYWQTPTPLGEAAFLQEVIAGEGGQNSESFLQWMTEQFKSLLGSTDENLDAIQYAYDQVYGLIYPNEDLERFLSNHTWQGDATGNKDRTTRDCYGNDEKTRASFKPETYEHYLKDFGTKICDKGNPEGQTSSTDTAVINAAGDYIGMVYTVGGNNGTSGKKRQNTVAINLNNLAQVFMTAIVEYQNSSNKSESDSSGADKYKYTNGELNSATLFDTNDTADNKTTFTIATGNNVSTGDSTSLEPSFYDTLFNLICTQGWTENDNINDADYLQELMKTGAVFISSINNDGYYYQSSYSTDTYISEVTDEEGVAQAEAKYNAEKAKIENKENTIDTKMKNLDTEISSLSTEYDTMKNVINKSIEKSFKRYDA